MLLKRPYLFHCTRPEYLESIKEKGLLKGFDGRIYMCDNVEDPFGFMCLRAFKFGPDKVFDVPGHGTIKIPQMEWLEQLLVLQVDTSKLDWDSMTEGDDHAPGTYERTVYAYQQNIPWDAITTIWTFDVASAECIGSEEVKHDGRKRKGGKHKPNTRGVCSKNRYRV